MNPNYHKACVDESALLPVVDAVNETYSRQAREGADRAYSERVATAFGYTAEELRSVPAGAHMGLSCGNTIARASTQEGETVVDLGSGGGIDVFLATDKVGPTGQVVGIDNSEDIISRARRNAAAKSVDVIFTENLSDLNTYVDNCDSTGSYTTISSATSGLADIGDLNQWARSHQIYAVKSDSVDVTVVPDPVPKSALKNWWDAYPIPASSPDSLECAEVADLIRNPKLGEKDFVVVDVRRNDHAGGHVRGSVQHPAQTFYDDLPEFYEAYKETKQVIFYCGSSNGRGPRYQDYLDQQRNTESKAFVMSGGAKKWVSSYKEQEYLVAFD